MSRACYVCKQPGDAATLRPYGADGQDICHPCMVADPDRRAEAERRFLAVFDSLDGPVVLTVEGPRPLAEVGSAAGIPAPGLPRKAGN